MANPPTHQGLAGSPTLCVLGLGYIGLPTASMFAVSGLNVLGVDVNPRVVEWLQTGRIHIEEPDLQTLVQAAVNSGQLRIGLEAQPADAFIIAVPTPITDEHRADLSFVTSAAESILPHLRRGNLVVLESTVPPRTTRDVLLPVLERSGLKAGEDFALAHCPERVLPGRILIELVQNDRIIGGLSAGCAERAAELYRIFVQGTLHQTDATTAEMVKVMENTCRDVNIALANQFAILAEGFGVDAWEAIDLANKHPRVQVLRPGPGVGGHCIAVDPWFLIESAPERAPLITAARKLNDAMPGHVVDLLRAQAPNPADGPIAAFGLAYKGDVDDVRESPAVEVVHAALRAGYEVRAHDPHVKHDGGMDLPPCFDLAGALEGAQALVLLTDHSVFRRMNPVEIGKSMRFKRLIDTRNALDHAAWQAAGFQVTTLGRGIPC
ncbi:MAG: nucleotide sugar dehydrogenase [Chloroflexota bacterium]